MGSNGKANKAADHGKDPVIIIENKMAKVDPTFHDDQVVNKSKMVPSECESTDESCHLKSLFHFLCERFETLCKTMI